MMLSKTHFFIGLLMVTCFSCKPKYEAPEINSGSTNPERFLMVGGTFASGYTDDALFKYGQENSISAYIHKSISQVQNSNFKQAFTTEHSVGMSSTGLSRLILGYKTDCNNETSLSPVRESNNGDASVLNNIYTGAPFNNMSIPNLKLVDMFNEDYANQNPFFGRMASSQTTTVLSDVMELSPSIFSVFIGLDDFMPYIKSGAKDDSLPNVTNFENDYRNLLQNLTQNGAKGVISTIPDITSSPYFTTVRWNDLVLDSANNAILNSIYNPLEFYFYEGNNPFMINDPDANMFGVRPIEEGELILLSVPLDSVKCYKMGTLFPFRDEFVLTHEEQVEIRARLNGINNTIRSLAAEFNLALVESEDFFNHIRDVLPYNGIELSNEIISGGAYGLDGIRLNTRTNALFANEFLTAINKQYNASYPMINATSLDAAFFP